MPSTSRHPSLLTPTAALVGDCTNGNPGRAHQQPDPWRSGSPNKRPLDPVAGAHLRHLLAAAKPNGARWRPRTPPGSPPRAAGSGRRPGQHGDERGLAHFERIAPQVVALQFDQVERSKLNYAHPPLGQHPNGAFWEFNRARHFCACSGIRFRHVRPSYRYRNNAPARPRRACRPR